MAFRHALDSATFLALAWFILRGTGGRITAVAALTLATGALVPFLARRQIQRAALLMTPNPFDAGERTIYVPFASRWREETHNWHGWVMGYDAATFAPRGVFCSM